VELLALLASAAQLEPLELLAQLVLPAFLVPLAFATAFVTHLALPPLTPIQGLERCATTTQPLPQ
jgi:hypothetical protein